MRSHLGVIRLPKTTSLYWWRPSIIKLGIMICVLHARGWIFLCPLTLEEKLVQRILDRAVSQRLKKNSLMSWAGVCAFSSSFDYSKTWLWSSVSFVIASWDRKLCCDDTKASGISFKKKPLSSDLLTKDSRQSVYSLPSPPLSHVHTSGMVQNDSFCFEKIHAIILKSSDSFHQQLLKTYKVPRCRGAGLGGSKRGKRYSFLPLLIFFYFKSIKLVILQGSFIRQSFLERGRGNKLCLSSSSLLQH